jgi:CRP/FNR family transcriptional regulator
MNDEGEEKILHIFKAGDIFGEVVFFNGGNYPATAEVIEDAQVGFISNEELEELLRDNVEIALSLIRIISKRLRRAQRQIAVQYLQDTKARIVGTLLQIVKEHGVKSSEGILIDLVLPHQELAKIVGTTRETVNRVLSALKKEGIIKIERQTITVLDYDALKSWL